jgi:predicted transport protein
MPAIMWNCPKCGREFKRKDQAHSCKLVSKKSLFEKRAVHLKQLYERIVKEIKKFGKYREENLPPDVIFFKTDSTFLAVKVKKDHLTVSFFLEKAEDVPPVSKFLQVSKYRVVHRVPIDQPEDINQQLISWIKRSYKLITEK